MKLFYIKNSVKESSDDFTVDLMNKTELKKEIETLDDGDLFIEYRYGKGREDGWWCCEMGEAMIDTEPVCGKNNCSYYAPRNGVSGICRDLRPCVVETGKTYGKE